ncbi:uncharacterized protein TNCV_3713261 [Trichonephila clavipes]|nr:uncharacterized protein TNCV_3713261 [Trichonephila clavipes]
MSCLIVEINIPSSNSMTCWNYRTHLEEEYANYRKPPDGADKGYVFHMNIAKWVTHEANRPGKQFNLMIDEEPSDNLCHVWSRIILLKYDCGEALKVRKDNWLQHLGDVALAV